jgi:ubiquinol-cytochrome c reductase cytochrome c subunit
MRTRSTVALRLLLLIGLAAGAARVTIRGQSASSVQEPSAPLGDADKGRRLFMKYGCYECHGAEGQGSTTGPRLGPNPLPLPGFSRYIRQPKQQMPPYTLKVLPDADVVDIHAFLRTRPRPPAGESINALR